MLWLGDHQGAQLDELDRRVVGLVATSLSNAPRNRTALVRAADELDLGIAYDIEAWRNQLPVDHRLRGQSWLDVGIDARRKVYVPEARPISSRAAKGYARRITDAQITPKTRVPPGTVVSTPGHFLEDDQLGVGRDNDILLAKACAREFRQRELGAPASGESRARRRRLFVTVLVNASQLDETTVAGLIAAYADLRVDGFFLWAANFNESLYQANLLLRLALGLQEAAERPVVGGGLWHWHAAALESGIAATCLGPQRLKLKLWPDEPEPVPEGEEPPGRATFIYHGPILGCLPVNGEAVLKRMAAFARRPCPCGMHPAAEPPRTAVEKAQHNAWWLMHESASALGIEHRASLNARVPEAREERAALRVGRIAACWSTVADQDARSSDRRVD